ncbi:MAG: ribokinase [Roseiflexaceae bacterium]|nr:ribokinase [Roseiflexaceae bacterium]
MIDYLLLGHLTRDLLNTGGSQPGGTALYAGLAAHQQQLQVGIVSARSELPDTWPVAIQLAWTNAATPPTFENHYTATGRTQLLHSAAAAIVLADVPEQWRNAPIVHFGPVIQEIAESLLDAFPGALIGVTPQGWMRRWTAPLPTHITYRPWLPTPAQLAQIDALVISIEDVQGDEALVQAYATHCAIVALTRGAGGATLFLDGQAVEIAATPVIERDPTGAGDVFAATLFCGLHRGKTPLAAAHAAAKVAAASVEELGVAGLLKL